MKILNNNLGLPLTILYKIPLYLARTRKISQKHHKVLENIATLVRLNFFCQK